MLVRGIQGCIFLNVNDAITSPDVLVCKQQTTTQNGAAENEGPGNCKTMISTCRSWKMKNQIDGWKICKCMNIIWPSIFRQIVYECFAIMFPIDVKCKIRSLANELWPRYLLKLVLYNACCQFCIYYRVGQNVSPQYSTHNFL